MAPKEDLAQGEIVSACKLVIERICGLANVADLAATIDIVLEERGRGRIVDTVCACPRSRLHVSKPLWLAAQESEREASVAAAVCHVICTLRDHDPATRTAGMAGLFGYGPVVQEPDWGQWEGQCRQVIETTYAFLNLSELAEKTSLKWNGRLKWPAAVCRWDAEEKRGTIELARRNWPLLIEEEQKEVVIHGCCALAASVAADLGRDYELLGQLGYRTPTGGYALFQPKRYGGGRAIGAPHRIHLDEVIKLRQKSGWGA